MKKFYWIISILVILIMIALAITPQIYLRACSQGILVWATVVLPAIFPFIFFTKILTDLGVMNILSTKFNVFTKVFKTPPISAFAFLTSILSGYPVGAKVVSDLYESGSITKEEAYKITTFTSNSGPMFILGSIGIGLLFSRRLGLIMLFSHILGAVLNGILYRNHKEKNFICAFKSQSIKNQFQPAELMWNSIVSILIIGGYICIFFVLIEMLNHLNIIPAVAFFFSSITGTNCDILIAIFNGIFEITHGCLDITNLHLSDFSSTIICCGLITFGGFSTMMQAIVFLQKFEMRLGFFLKQKLTHTLFSIIVCAILLLIF